MNPIKVEIQRGSDGLVNVVKLSKAGRQCAVQYDTTRGFTVTGSLPRHFADVLAIQAAYSPTPMDIVAQTIGNINVDIAAQTVGNIEVDITAQSVGNIDVNLAASAATVDVDVTAQSVGNLAVDINAQSVGNLDINIAAQAADVDVNITNASITIAGAVTISTSGGTNIVIDELTQGAYTERQSTLSNNGASASWSSPTGTSRDGKFFPRGARGFINTIGFYSRDAGAGGGTITYYVAPEPGMGYTFTGTVAVGAGGAAQVRTDTINQFWNYDSIFIWAMVSGADIDLGYDGGTPNDCYQSTDSGVTWTPAAVRMWFSVAYVGQTIGDLPVSGTINNIPVPAVTTGSGTSGVISVNNNTLTDIITITGAGTVKRTAFYTEHDEIEIRFYTDGVLIPVDAFLGYDPLSPYYLNAEGYDQTTEVIQLTKHTTGGTCNFAVNLPLPFKRSFLIRAYQSTGAAKDVAAGVIYEAIS